MSHGKTDREIVETVHNVGRYFVENRQVAWVLLVGTIIWGIIGYVGMPKAKDPTLPIGVAATVVVWPGVSADKIEELITKKLETKIAENPNVERIESNTRNSVVVITIYLKQTISVPGPIFDDINLKLDSIHDLPANAGPIQFLKDFGDTAALLLTVASPKVSEIELELRARTIQRAIDSVRAKANPGANRVTVVTCFPSGVTVTALQRITAALAPAFEQHGLGRDARFVSGPGFLGIDVETDKDDTTILTTINQSLQSKIRLSELHPDIWPMTIIHDTSTTLARLGSVAGDKYTYRELDDYTETLRLHLQSIPIVSKVTRSGVLAERIFLEYSQERLAAYGVNVAAVDQILAARNIQIPGGILEIGGKNITIDPSGELKSEDELGTILVGASPTGLPVYLRDVVSVERGYESPARYLNFISTRDASGQFLPSRAVTLSIQMRAGAQIAELGRAVDATLKTSGTLLPEDLIFKRVSDQPLQVEENTELFMRSLYEAIALVVLVAFVGFWEWRSAMLMALSIPITLAMTFGLMIIMKLDIQQVSLASLIIALGLLVDDPVVAGDSIKRALGSGWGRVVAAWLGPTKLATAILFATITNIVAYLPFLILTGDVGRFIYSLPIVLTCSLVASRIVSMTFLPLLGYVLLRPPKVAEPTPEFRRTQGLAKIYCQAAGWAIDHRKLVFGLSLIPVLLGFLAGTTLKPSFFPKDQSYLQYVDVWLPEDAPLSATKEIAVKVDRVIQRVADEYMQKKALKHPDSKPILDSVTSFIGGGGPRFWFSIFPEQAQLNYAQLLIKVNDREDTFELSPLFQDALNNEIAGARIDVRLLENGKAVGHPVQIRVSGEDIPKLRELAENVKKILRENPIADRVRDDWGSESFAVQLKVDPDRANTAGITNLDVAVSSAVGMNGRTLGMLREKDKLIPIVARLRSEERSQLADIQNLYVYSLRGPAKVPLRQVSNINYSLVTERIRRRNQFHTITISSFPVEGALPSEVMALANPKLDALKADLLPGYTLEVGGEQEEQQKGFVELSVVLFLSVVAIFLALVVQFKSAIKPVMVFAAIPYGVAGALTTLAVFKTPFGFMAFLGIISLIGVIVSHIIVLFDFVEEKHAEGGALREALLDAAILRLRPVAITTGATVLGLIPLALHGGALWEPLCYAQIGGLTIATALTLFIVPVLYAICVFDLKIIKWDLVVVEAEAERRIGGVAGALTQFEFNPYGAKPNPTMAIKIPTDRKPPER